MAAAAMNTPELKLEADEAEGMAKAIAEVARHYPQTVDPKTMAWINLMFALAVVYGPRAYLIRERHKMERATKVSTTVTTFAGVDMTGRPVDNSVIDTMAQNASQTPRNASDVPFTPPPGVHFAGLDDN